jgi:hypothetical protein
MYTGFWRFPTASVSRYCWAMAELDPALVAVVEALARVAAQVDHAREQAARAQGIAPGEASGIDVPVDPPESDAPVSCSQPMSFRTY